MSSDCPPQLQLSIPSSTTSFKRSFEQFGVDLDSPVAHDAGGSGNNNDRNKRARSATSFSDGSSDTLASSPQSSSEASGSGSRSSGSGTRRQRALQDDWAGQTAAVTRAGTALPISSHQPPRLPTPDIQDIDMPDYPLVDDNDSDAFSSSNLPSPPLSQPDDSFRLSLQRFNEFDSEISVLRQRSPALARSPTLPPTLPPLSIFEEIPSQTTIEYLPDSPVSVGSAAIFPRHALPDSEAASEFSLDFSGSSFATSQQHSPIDIATSQQHSPTDEPSPQVEPPASSASNDLGFTFRERLDSALGSLRSASPLVPGLDDEEERNSARSSSSFTRPTLPNPPTLPPIITDTETENVMWNDEPLPTPASEGMWNMPPSLPSLEDLRDHALPSPSLRGLHHWLNMDEPTRRPDAPGTSSDDDPGPSNRYRDRVRDIPIQSSGFTDTSARRGGPSGRRSPASAAAVRMLDQVMWNSSYSSSLFSGQSRSPPPSSERPSQFLSHHPSSGRPPAHFPLQGADSNNMNLDAWLAAAESAGPSDTTIGSSPPVHHSWTESDDRHMLSQHHRSRPANLGSFNSLVSENASEARRRSQRAELLERATTFASSSSQVPLMEDGRRSHLPAWDAEWAQGSSVPESQVQQQPLPPDRDQRAFQAQRAARQSLSESHQHTHTRPSSSRSFEEMFEAFMGPENDEFRQRTRPQRQQHPEAMTALSSSGRERVLYPRARASSPRPGPPPPPPPPPPPQQATHRRISSWSNSVSAPGGSTSALDDTSAHTRWLLDSQSTSERDALTSIYGSDYRGSTAREEQPRPYLPIPSLPSPDLGGIFDRAPPPSAPPPGQHIPAAAALQHTQRERARRGMIARLNQNSPRRLRNSIGSIRGVTNVFELSDDEDDDDVEMMGQSRFGRGHNGEREAMGGRARTGGVEESLYNRHERFLSLASGVGAGNENGSSSGSDAEPFGGEASGTSRRSTYSAHRPRTPPMDTSRYPTPTHPVGSGGNFMFRPSEPSQVPPSNIHPFDPSSFAPGPFRNTLQSIAMERNSRAARHYASTVPARNSQPSHAPSIPPLAFEEDGSNFQGRAPPPPRSDARYAYLNRPPPPPPPEYASYLRPALGSRIDQFQQRRPPPVPPGATSSSAMQNSDLHRYLSRQARMEASRIDDSDGVPPAPSRGDVQGFNSAIEVLRHDGLTNARSQQLIDRYHRERGEQQPPPRPLPHLHPQSLSQSDQSLLRTYSSSRPEAMVRAVSDVFDVADEDTPLPARPTRNAGFGAEGEYDRGSRDTLAFRGRRARAFRHPILARMGGRPRALGDFVADEEFDTSYEGLLQLAASVGEAKPRSTPSHVISSMETAQYKDWATADSDKRCPICLDDYTPTDPVLKLTNCSHWLHRDCLQQWLGGASTCPVCRKPVHGPSSPRQSGLPAPPQIQDIQNYWPLSGTWRRGPPPPGPGPGPGGSGNVSSGYAGASGAWPRR